MSPFRVSQLQVVVFDVNETLTDMEALRPRLDAAGADPALLELWFASTLRDGIALAAAGGFASFAEVATAALAALAPDADAASASAGFKDPRPHDDVGPGLRALADRGLRIVTLSNGSPDTAAVALERAGASDVVEQTLSVEAVQRWKPAREPYEYACERCGVGPTRAMLVAVHPWDVDGAKRAGLGACFLDRREGAFPRHLEQPDITIGALTELAAAVSSA